MSNLDISEYIFILKLRLKEKHAQFQFNNIYIGHSRFFWNISSRRGVNLWENTTTKIYINVISGYCSLDVGIYTFYKKIRKLFIKQFPFIYVLVLDGSSDRPVLQSNFFNYLIHFCFWFSLLSLRQNCISALIFESSIQLF